MSSYIHPVIYELPPDYCQRIGQFITRWAYLEWRLKETMYTLMGTDSKLGRVAIREPRVVSYLSMLEDAADLRAIHVSVNWKGLKDIMGEIEKWRDRFAHSIWLDVPDAGMPTIQVLGGKTVEKAGGRATKSRILPQGFRVSLGELDNAIAGLDRAVQLIDDLQKEIAAQVASGP